MGRKKLKDQKGYKKRQEKLKIELEKLDVNVALNEIKSTSKKAIRQIKQQVKKVKTLRNPGAVKVYKEDRNLYRGMCKMQSKESVDDLIMYVIHNSKYNSSEEAFHWIAKEMGDTSKDVTEQLYDQNVEKKVKNEFIEATGGLATKEDIKDYMAFKHAEDLEYFTNKTLIPYLRGRLVDEKAAGILK